MEYPLPAAILLAGGQSSRMGRDKRTLTDADNRTLMERAAGCVRWTEERCLAAGADPLRLEGFTSVPDCVPHRGPIGGLVSCLRLISAPWALALPCDMPGLTAEALKALFDHRADDADCVLEGGLATGELAFYRLLQSKLRVTTVPVERLPCFTPRLLDNVNTPEDYAQFLASV